MIEFLFLMFILAFVCEFIDTSIGGGYGTILTPLALSIGISPLTIIPAILFSEICTGFTGGYFHHRFGNLDWKIVGVDFIFGFIGITLGVVTGIQISSFMLKLWIGIIVLACGLLMLFSLKDRYIIKGEFKLKNDVPLTLLCSFNKGVCYDNQTEILTKRGWLFFKDLSIKDEVACLSKNHEFYWSKPTAIQKHHYKGKMIKFNHQTVNLLVTPNHKVYVREQNSNHYSLVRADKLDKYAYCTINKVNWRGEEKEWFYLPKVKYHDNAHGRYIEKDRIKMDDWLAFLGWYISEGSVVKNNKNYIVSLKQFKKENIPDIKKCLTKIGYNWNYNSKSGNFRIYNKQLHSYLSSLGTIKQKHIPQEYLNLSKRQLKILLNTLMKGDGCIKNNTYYTCSKKLADQIQELSIKLGYNATLKMRDLRGKKHVLRDSYIENKSISYIIYFRKSKETFMITKDTLKKQEYNDMTYCCTVPEHVILVRRGKHATWCGNSGGGYGPVSTAGLIAVKAPPKKAVGSTILSEGIVCLMGYLMFMMLGKTSIQLNSLTITITLGALLATFPAAYFTKKIDSHKLKAVIAVFIVTLGIWTLSHLLFI